MMPQNLYQNDVKIWCQYYVQYVVNTMSQTWCQNDVTNMIKYDVTNMKSQICWSVTRNMYIIIWSSVVV